MKSILASLVLLLFISSAFSAVQTKLIEYRDGETVLEGYLAWDDTARATRPGILVVHDWMGMQDFAKKQAERLAGLGYVAFAVDVFGKAIRPKNSTEASAAASRFYGNRASFRHRIHHGLEVLRSQPSADKEKVAAIGYCFGGAGVLELARSGADIAGVVSFHGSLVMQGPADEKPITAKVLVLHGADDPHVPWTHVTQFTEEMNSKKVDWQLVAYSNAVHSFTNPAAGNDNSKGSAYNADADRRSWIAMQDFFTEIFGDTVKKQK